MKLTPHSKLLALALGVTVAALVQPGQYSAQAATYTWDPTQNPTSPAGGNGTWDTSASNWSNGASDNVWTDTTGTSDTAVIGGSAGTVNLGSALGASGIPASETLQQLM